VDARIADVLVRHGLEPDASPDPGRPRVPDPLGAALLPLRLPERVVGGIVDLDHELVLPGQTAEVDGEVRVAAPVLSELAAVEEDGGPPVDGREAEQHAPAAPALGHVHGPPVADPLVDLCVRADAGQRRFERPRHDDRPWPAAGELDLPRAVEAQPLRPRRLRERMTAHRGAGPRPSGGEVKIPKSPPTNGSAMRLERRENMWLRSHTEDVSGTVPHISWRRRWHIG
jgi:hypothetical protein